MTIAIALKVGDGIVLGADSATTLSAPDGYKNSYFNAEKVFNLVKRLPLGFVTAGLGGLDGRSIASLAKDLRLRLKDSENKDWWLNPESYTVELAAERVKKFFFDELYEPTFRGAPQDADVPDLEFFVAGYSANEPHAEIWRVFMYRDLSSVECYVGRNNAAHGIWTGQPEALNRLIRGYSSEIYEGLVAAGVDSREAANFLLGLDVQSLIHPAMPIQDAIDLVHYMVDVTAGFVRFAPGYATVHPPTDSATITKHEGFRWVRRKHYFSPELNRPIDRHDV